MGHKALTQIILSVIGLVIIFTYIKPALVTIGEKQNDLYEYVDAADKAAELNRQLFDLTAAAKSFNVADMAALDAYLPSSIDTMKVMSDVVSIAASNDMRVADMSADALVESVGEIVHDGEVVSAPGVNTVEFNLTVYGTYESFKDLLQAFERNNYPLEVVAMTISDFKEEEGSTVTSEELLTSSYILKLRTYEYTPQQN